MDALPWDALRARYDARDAGRAPVVLVLPGSLSPVHRMHVRALEVARDTLERRGFHVVAGFFGPSSDAYVRHKLDDAALPLETRNRLIELVCAEHDWLFNFPAGWADGMRISWVLQQAFSAESEARPLTAWLVLGGDLAARSGLFPQAVVVPRPGSQAALARQMARWAEAEPVPDTYVVADEVLEDMSSTAVRAALLGGGGAEALVAAGVHEAVAAALLSPPAPPPPPEEPEPEPVAAEPPAGVDHVPAAALDAIRRRHAAGAPGRRCFLVLPGSFSPVHLMHVRALEVARAALEARGFDVVAGFTGPSSDGYVRGKLKQAALPLATRNELLDLALAGSDWLFNYPAGVASGGRILAALSEGFEGVGLPMQGWSVKGDNFAARCRVRPYTVAVPRPGYGEALSARLAGSDDVDGTFVVADEELDDVSSTAIRAALAAGDVGQLEGMLAGPVLARLVDRAGSRG